MQLFHEVDPLAWGYDTRDPMTPLEILDRLALEVRAAVARNDVLRLEGEEARDCPGCFRVSTELPVSPLLFEQFFASPAGYRAQYFVGESRGRAYNRLACAVVAEVLVEHPQLFPEGVTRELCLKSLDGPFTTLWFPREITSPDYSPRLAALPELITAERWVRHWRTSPAPRKGLLVPVPERPAMLLTGTFVQPGDWCVFDPQPERARTLFETGWA